MEKLIFEKLLPFLAEWKTRRGYLAVLTLLVLGCTFVRLPLSSTLVAIYLLGYFLWTSFWLIASGRLIIPASNRKIVVLSFNVEKEGRRNYARILADLHRRLKELRLTTNVKIVDAASDLFAGTSQAEKFRERSGVDLVVWGRSFYGNVDSEKVLKFEVYHTCVLSPTLKEKLQLFLTDLTVILQKRKWTVVEMNELVDVKILADDLLETCLFIIGIYYYDEGHIEDASSVFESILPILEMKGQGSKDNIKLVLAGRARAILSELYFLRAQMAHLKGDHSTAIRLWSSILPLVPNKVGVLIGLARCYYLAGDFFNAQKCTNEIRHRDKKHPAVSLNFAFFGIIQKNYERVRFWYDEILKLKEIRDVDLLSVVTFLDDEYKKSPSEHAFLYALAIVNGYVDPIIRKGDLQRFLRLTKNRAEYDILRRRARELLSHPI